ncbi:unnamed protein product [Rotaria sordida]|uniref:Uncharacterized protein n=1 Tax=Rotaria sordida TaxID=392033 RepID=A0A814MT73_9BILA|nr:unnamed protein product [Rotaria sordida]
MADEDVESFIQDFTVLNRRAINLIAFENEQEDWLYNAEDNLVQAVQNPSHASQNDIKLLEDRLTRRLLLQHVTGLFVNTINMKEIQKKKSLQVPNRYKHLFLEEGIDIAFIEGGNIMFIYERTSGGDTAAAFGNADIESFYILLIPKANETVEDDNNDVKKRLIKIIKKRLPDVTDKYSWMLVKNFNNDIKNIQEERDGKLIIKTDNIIGRGRYLMQNHESYRTTITYDLESPAEIDFFQNQFNIAKHDSFYIMVLNPLVTMSSSHHCIKFPENVQKIFQPSYRWSTGHTDMMDIEGCEMLLINRAIVNVQQLLDKLESETIEEIDFETIEEIDFETIEEIDSKKEEEIDSKKEEEIDSKKEEEIDSKKEEEIDSKKEEEPDSKKEEEPDSSKTTTKIDDNELGEKKHLTLPFNDRQ